MAAMTGRDRLIIFTRYPEAGVTKTRLIPALGAEGAADLHRRMTLHTLEWAAELRRRENVDVEVRFTGPRHRTAADMQAMFGGGFHYVPQGEGDLGERLERSFAQAFEASNMRTAVAIGADCPGVTADVMRGAVRDLRWNDVVIGPAYDGGYYLIGLRGPALAPALFRGIDWGTHRVLEQTLAAAMCARARVRVSDRLDDVDRPEDLPVWEVARRDLAPPGLRGRVAVVIPTVNEAAYLPGALERVRGLDDVQVIVADDGSSDGTREIARSYGAEVIASGGGRGSQMNAGAAAAHSNTDVLVFCHADTLLPVGFERLARAALTDSEVIAGAFTLRIEGDTAGLRRVERAVAWRCRHLQMPYGDQAMFLRAETFRELGGFAPLPLMEDYQLVRRLRSRSRGCIVILDEPVITSGRAWQKAGVVRATLANQGVIAGYHLGVRAATLARLRRWMLNAPQR